MAEVLSSGTESGAPRRHRPGGHRHRTGLLAAALLAAGAAVLAVEAGGDRPRAAPPSVPYRLDPAPAPAVFRLDGDPGTGPAGVRMLIGGRQPGVLDTGTGAVAPLPVPAVPGDVAELDHAGGTTTVLLHSASRLRSRAFAFWPGGTGAGLGRAVDVLPLRDGGVLAEDCSGPGDIGPCTLTAYGRAGAKGWTRTVPRKLDLIRDTPYGLVTGVDEDDVGRLVRLEDARSGAVHRIVGRVHAVLGADDRQVVFTAVACGSECELTVADLDGGSFRVLPRNPGIPAVAAFSRDGRRLAVGYAGMPVEDRSASAQRDGRVAVIELTGADRWQLVPELTTGAASTALPVWAPDGRLLLAVPTTGVGSGRVVAWRPGAARVTILPVQLTGFYGTPGLAAALT
jgi:hypothetical protein